jgi:hypothetical protein
MRRIGRAREGTVESVMLFSSPCVCSIMSLEVQELENKLNMRCSTERWTYLHATFDHAVTGVSATLEDDGGCKN